jgi:CHASE3 domain-containing protein
VVLTEELVSISNEAARKARDFLLTGDESHLRELEATRERFREVHEKLSSGGVVRPEERERLARLRELWFAAGAAANRATEARQRTGRMEGETERIVREEMLPERVRFDVELEALMRYERSLYEAAQREADAVFTLLLPRAEKAGTVSKDALPEKAAGKVSKDSSPSPFLN